MRISLIIFSILLGSLLVACGSGGGYGNSSSGYNTPSTSRNASALGVLSGHLVDATGFALYTTASPCTGSCLTVWPPMNASSTPAASGGLTQSNISLQAGQVTYKGSLLYYFESDTSPGQATGNGVGGFVLATP